MDAAAFAAFVRRGPVPRPAGPGAGVAASSPASRPGSSTAWPGRARSASRPRAPTCGCASAAARGSTATASATCPAARSSPARSRTASTASLRFDGPQSRPAGVDVEGVELELRDGEVVRRHAPRAARSTCDRALATDDGARRLGELGIGTNFGIDRPIGTILFDEKIGGTVHLALGRSYPETGGERSRPCTGTSSATCAAAGGSPPTARSCRRTGASSRRSGRSHRHPAPEVRQSCRCPRACGGLRSGVRQPHRRQSMNLYAIRRRDFWDTPEALQETAARSAEVGEEMSDDVRWIRTYVVPRSPASSAPSASTRARAPRRCASRPSAPACRPTRSPSSPTP